MDLQIEGDMYKQRCHMSKVGRLGQHATRLWVAPVVVKKHKHLRARASKESSDVISPGGPQASLRSGVNPSVTQIYNRFVSESMKTREKEVLINNC